MSLSQLQVQHLRSLNDSAVTCAIARIESLEKSASDQELRERTQNINTEQRFHELQTRVAAVSSEALQYKKQIEDFEAQVSSLVAKEKELLARHSDASIAAAREASRAKRLEQQVDELHRDKAELTAAAQRRLEQLDAAGGEIERITSSLQQAAVKISDLEAAGVRADRLLREKDLEAENARVSLKMEFEYEKANELKSANDRASAMRRDMFAEIEDLKRTLSSKISECEAANSRAAHDLLLQSQKREELIQSKSQALELKHQLSMQETLHKLELERRDDLVKILEQEKVRLDAEKDRVERSCSALDGQLKGALAELQSLKLAFAEEKTTLQSSAQEAVAHAKTLSEELANLSHLRGAIQAENVSSTSAHNLLMMSPAATAASIDRDGSLSKTELYAKYVEALKVLHTERQERVKVEKELSAVLAVMEENGPQIQQELQEGHLAKNAISEMQDRLDKAVRDNLQKRRELDRCADHVQKLDRENQLLDTNCQRLQKQLRHALKQNELLKSNKSMESLSSAPGDPDSVIDYVWELGGDIEQALIKNEQLQRMIDAMQSESDKEMQLRKEQRIREAEAETMKLRRELDEMRDAREKQMSLFKALNERCESFKAQLQHRSPAVSAPAVDVTDSPLFQQLLQDKEKLQAEFDAFKEARFSTSRDEIEKLRQLLHSAQHAAALAQGKLEGVQMERDTYKNDLASRTDELPRMREKCAKADSITAQAEANAQMHAKAAILAEERVKALEFQLHQAAMRADHERARCDSLDKDKEALRGEVQRMQELVSKCHASFDFESKHRLSELSRMRDEAQEREVALRKARDELSTARLAAEEHQHSQTRAIDLLQQQLDDAERRAKSASDSTQAMKARIASLEASLSESSVRRSPASNQHPILPSTIGAAGELDPSLVSEITSLQEQLFAVQSERDTYFRMSGEFERELVASGAALKELQGKIDAANSQIQEHAQRLADQVKKSSADAAEAAANMLRLQTQLQADVDAAKGRAAIAEASALSAKEETEVQIARANNLLQAEAAARAIAASERARLEAMTQDHAAGISRAQLLQKSLSDSEEALYRTKSELDREKEVAASSLAAATSTAKEFMDKVRVLETRLSDAQQQNSLLENQLQRLERSLSDHGAPETEAPESDREQRELRAYVERERDRLKHQLEASEATCRRLKFQLDAKEREAAELQAEVEISRQRLSGPCYTQVDLDRLGNLQKQVSLLTESNEHLRSQESTAHKLALQWEERYNGVQSEMMQLRQAATLHAQLLASAEGQRDEYAKSFSELREQYSRISSKNQDIDPLVHEELKSKHLELDKKYQESFAKVNVYVEKLNEKKEEQKKLKAEVSDLNQKLMSSQAAEKEAEKAAQQKQQQLQQDIQQLQIQLQQLKAQYEQQQERDQSTISQLEKNLAELRKELALASRLAPVRAVADAAAPDGTLGKSAPSSALPVAAVTQTLNLNPAAPEFGANSQFHVGAAATAAGFVPAVEADSAVDAESSGDKRPSDSDPSGSRQIKRAKNKVVSFNEQIFVHPASDPVTNCVKTSYFLRVSGFPTGEQLDNAVAKLLFPNINVVGISHLDGRPAGTAFFESNDSLEAALQLGSSRHLREGVTLTVNRPGKKNVADVPSPRAADSMASPVALSSPFSFPSPLPVNPFASSAAASNSFAFVKPQPPPGDPPGYSSAVGGGAGFQTSSQFGGSSVGFSFASGQSSGFASGGFAPAFAASSTAMIFSSNPFSIQASVATPGFPVFGGVSVVNNPTAFVSSTAAASFLPSVSQPVVSPAFSAVPAVTAAAMPSATPADSIPVPAPPVSRVAKIPKTSSNILGMGSAAPAAAAQVTPLATFPTPASISMSSSADAAANEFLSAVSQPVVSPAFSAVPAVTAAAMPSATPADSIPVPAPPVSRVAKIPKASSNILGMGSAAPAAAAQVTPLAPATAPAAAEVAPVAPALPPAPAISTSAPSILSPAAPAATPVNQNTIRSLPRRAPAAAPAATTPAPPATASAAVLPSAAATVPASTDEEEKRKKIAEKLAAKKAAMEQTAPAAAAPAPAVTAAAPDVAIATSTAPVIITPQAIGWAAPVLNFGSVLPLQSSPFFPNLASVSGASASAMAFNFAPSVFGNDAAVASSSAAGAASSAEGDSQPDSAQ